MESIARTHPMATGSTIPPMPNTASVTVNYNASTQQITVTPDPVPIGKNGKITFCSPDADLVIVAGDSSARPTGAGQRWFVKDDDTNPNGKNDVAFFVPQGGSRVIQVKDSNALLDPATYSYSVIIMTVDANGNRDKVPHPLDPTVIIRPS